MRRELGCAARAFMRRRAHRRLGFVRLSDYARERLGVSARTLQSAAWLATRLDELPAVSAAYDRSEISWAAARAICSVAVAADEDEWLRLARRSTVDTLERLVARARHPDGVPDDPDGAPNEIDGEPAVRWRFACPARVRALWRHALELASRAAGELLADWRGAEVIAAEGSSGAPRGRSIGDRVLLEMLRLARRARRRRGDDPATQSSSEAPTPVGRAFEVPVADRPFALASAAVFSDPPTSAALFSYSPAPDARCGGERVRGARAFNPPTSAALPANAPAPSDPFALDARLAEAMRVLRTIEPRIGRLLRVVIDRRIYRSFGCATFEDYVRGRLGIAVRKAWALLKVEKATLRSADFDRAYRDGRLSWVRALSLLPVLDRTTAPAWIARAESVTVRRLCDEIEGVLCSRDALGSGVSLAPPPVDSRLPSPASPGSGTLGAVRVAAPDECRDLSLPARLQIRAHDARGDVAHASLDGKTASLDGTTAALPATPSATPSGAACVTTPAADWRHALEISDAEIRFRGPASVVALLRDVLDAFAVPEEPRWVALERLLRHVITHWESTPRHSDPVFARDGWRCTVPACSSRRNLHDHHIRFRSRGGDNRRDNRTAVCAAHHLHGLHDGTIRASGVAPHAVEWQLGVRPGASPFLAFVGDRLCQPDDAIGAARREAATQL